MKIWQNYSISYPIEKKANLKNGANAIRCVAKYVVDSAYTANRRK